MKEVLERLVEEMNVYNIEKQKVKKTLLKEKLSIKVKARFVVGPERSVNRLETRQSLLLNSIKESLSCCLFHTTTI